MHDFKPVSDSQTDIWPTRFRGDLSVVLNCHAIRFQTKLLDKVCKACRLGQGGEITGLSIQNDRKGHIEMLAGGLLPCRSSF